MIDLLLRTLWSHPERIIYAAIAVKLLFWCIVGYVIFHFLMKYW